MKKLKRQWELEKQRCQSCGMPRCFDPKGGGTEADGSISKEFCSFCYDSGKFKEPELQLSQMQQRARMLLRKRNQPWYIRAYMAHRITTLSRWRKK
ncbi:zinc ribbon domain-containing protein [Acidithiobacillus sp. IBUN Pt1247-S3]|uniref:zinc ribbon domain-containing protein n=1 Tax=Acidithiobacillus sp. IBUN Pt1247-S3 TaxID=3166642 RepID=UPI0034E399E5